MKFRVRSATTPLESYLRKKHTSKMQWIQKPKMIRLGEEGSLQEIGAQFLQLLNEHDSSADFDLEQQSSEMIRQFGIATHIPASYRMASDIDRIQFQMNRVTMAEGVYFQIGFLETFTRVLAIY